MPYSVSWLATSLLQASQRSSRNPLAMSHRWSDWPRTFYSSVVTHSESSTACLEYNLPPCFEAVHSVAPCRTETHRVGNIPFPFPEMGQQFDFVSSHVLPNPLVCVHLCFSSPLVNLRLTAAGVFSFRRRWDAQAISRKESGGMRYGASAYSFHSSHVPGWILSWCLCFAVCTFLNTRVAGQSPFLDTHAVSSFEGLSDCLRR
jgi:hypothetical protein